MDRIRRTIALLTLAAMTGAAVPAHAAVECLTDAEIRTLVRSVYTRAIGRVMRLCAENYPNLNQRAIQATSDFLTTYAEDMRRNRVAANQLMARIYENWEYALEKLLAEGIAGDEAWARFASERDCLGEVEKIEDMVAMRDYERVMTNERTTRQFETERGNVPRCE